jgi:hypothetical protein
VACGPRCSRGRRALVRAAADGAASVLGRWLVCRSRATPASAAAAPAAALAPAAAAAAAREAVAAVGDVMAARGAAGLWKQRMARQPSELEASRALACVVWY